MIHGKQLIAPLFGVAILCTEEARVAQMMRLAIHTVILVSVGCSALAAPAQDRPAFCEPVPDALLGGLQAPYSRSVAPDGSVYCEGLPRNPIALPPTSVVSVKQDQVGNAVFVPDKMASLTWCDDSHESVHLRLRSFKSPMFALDAMKTVKFEWRTDLIAKWRPIGRILQPWEFEKQRSEGKPLSWLFLCVMVQAIQVHTLSLFSRKHLCT